MRHLMIMLAVPLCSLLLTSRPADAAPNFLQCTYKVQVEYWFWDSNYSYWSTVLETTDQDEAQLMYDLLLYAKQNGNLNAVVPNLNWKYIAVDVRLKTECSFAIVPSFWELVDIGPITQLTPTLDTGSTLTRKSGKD
ncbi:hypothetical protein Mal4_46910 [Maioricimonas rarisocia]|uniref:Uncharacterized protein n=1 Tax=Maioricimonas rarisocia TaxID=2528026 RepID=A0A517ZCZ7_9PLAN|nr:hypothetical protein [Maioricimonas rarisocia]QDU40335.1 hypothetical protein Mal4_46910 [Maioricimonas rarisocia]